MSVNAINAADQQPQRKSSPIVPSLVAGTVLGGAGYAGGHYFSRKRPDLDAVFAMTNDEFKKSTEKGLESATDVQKDDLEKIKKARKEYADAGIDKFKASLDKSHDLNKIARGATLEDDNLGNNVTKYKKELNDKKVKITNAEGKEIENVTKDQVINAVKKARKELAEAPEAEKAAKQTALDNAMKDLRTFRDHSEVKEIRDNLRSAQKALGKAEWDAIKENENAKSIRTEITNLNTEYTNARNTKLTEIKGRKEITDAFESVKKLFAKEGKGKTAWIAAACAAAVGLIGGFILGGSKNDVA